MRNRLMETVRRLFGQHTYDVNGQWAVATEVERESLIRDVMAVIDIQGMPDAWDRSFVYETLLADGYFCITDTFLGVIPINGGVTGHNVWHRPTNFIIANPVLGNLERIIDVDCAVVKLQYNYHGIHEILDLYAYMLGACDASIACNLMNTRVTFVSECSNAAQEKAMRKMYENMSFGSPAVFMRRGGKSDYFFTNPKQSYIAADIQLLKQKIRNEFLGLFGIPSVNPEKKERLVSSEVDAGNADIQYNLGHFIDSINEGLAVANALYGLNMHAERKVYSDGYAVKPDAVGAESLE